MVLMTKAEGVSTIRETIFENLRQGSPLKTIERIFGGINAFADHNVCIKIYPTPPECLHDEKKNNVDRLLIGAAGAAFLAI